MAKRKRRWRKIVWYFFAPPVLSAASGALVGVPLFLIFFACGVIEHGWAVTITFADGTMGLVAVILGLAPIGLCMLLAPASGLYDQYWSEAARELCCPSNDADADARIADSNQRNANIAGWGGGIW